MNIRTDKTNLELIQEVQNQVEAYLIKYNIKSLIIGISGGFDSAFNAAILKPVCDKLSVTLIGTYIHIETNKQCERDRAVAIGKAFCHTFEDADLTQEYTMLNIRFNTADLHSSYNHFTKEQLIRHGNIKARLRMIYLYNLAARYKGIVVDNDNKTERMLGFWTICGDIGDITPLASFFKTEAYELAKSYLNTLKHDEQKKALQACIDAVPTDGLGITSSDVEQFGVSSYNEVDAVLKDIEKNPTDVCPTDDKTYVKIWNRWHKSKFKRNHPYRIQI